MDDIELICIGYQVPESIHEKFSFKLTIRKVGSKEEVRQLCDTELPDPRINHVAGLFYSPSLLGMDVHELAQTLAYKYPERPLFFITQDLAMMDNREMMKKNGFADLFVDPFESELILNKIISVVSDRRNALNANANLKPNQYSGVKLVDIQIGSVMEFDIYIFLSANKKYVKFLQAGVPVDEEKMQRLQKHEMNLVYIPKEQTKKFYQYTANQLSNLNKNTKISETEKQERLQNSLRTITYRVFDSRSQVQSSPAIGREIFTELKEIVDNYIIGTDQGSWYQKIQMLMGIGHDPYSHSSRVSSLATLFSLALGEGRPEIIAVAGLVHDLGEGLLPEAIVKKPLDQLSKDEIKQYQMHPEFSVKLLKERRMAIDQILSDTILLHHKRWNGSGFPATLKAGDKIPIEAQFLGIADEFDELTAIEEGHKKVTPQKAFDQMIERLQHDPRILKRLKTVFTEQSPGSP